MDGEFFFDVLLATNASYLIFFFLTIDISQQVA